MLDNRHVVRITRFWLARYLPGSALRQQPSAPRVGGGIGRVSTSWYIE